MITIKNKYAIESMSRAGKLLAEMFEQLKSLVKEDVTTEEIDSWITEYQNQNNLISSTIGYMGYKHASCVSLNDEVVHGIPGLTKLKNGDLVKIDVCASYNGYCADMARSFFVGTNIDQKAKLLVDTAQASLDAGISQAYSGNRISDISFAIQTIVENNKFGIVKDFAGHGIGKKMHEDPEILNYGKPGTGALIKPGMAFAIEPMITAGDYKVYVSNDSWTVKTKDKSLAAHIEDTVIITENGPIIITRL